uniref:Regulator of G protein signaling 2 n=1 Tax=Cyprinodon variegatus TaxID=28743 RepID=A0A3Q2CMG2_CYPVA
MSGSAVSLSLYIDNALEKTYETDLLGDSLETVLSKKSNFLLLSGISKVMSWLATAVFIKLLCSFSVKGGQRAFRDFLKTEFCEENLDFWLACKEYQTCDSQERRTQMAARIYDEFIRNNSPKQVNLDFHTKETIRQSLEKPSLSCFRVAEKKIYILMENCSFPRFIETDILLKKKKKKGWEKKVII